MNVIHKILKRGWAIYFYIVFVSLFLLLYPLFRFGLHKPARYRFANRVRTFWSSSLFFLTGIIPRYQIEGKLEKGKRYVFCPNHSSLLDIPLFNIAYGDYNHSYMAKEELESIPLFGIFFRTMDIAVNRNSRIQSVKAFRKAKEVMENGWNMVIFPEGTTSDYAPEMLPFKSGPFRLAIDAKAYVVPVSILDNWRLFLYHGGLSGRPGIARMIIHEPIDTSGMTDADADELKQKVFDIINSTLKKEHEGRQSTGR